MGMENIYIYIYIYICVCVYVSHTLFVCVRVYICMCMRRCINAHPRMSMNVLTTKIGVLFIGRRDH